MKAFKILPFVIIDALLSLTFLSCGGGGGGGGGGTPPATSTVITGHVVDGFVAGATVTACQVNANGTLGAQIGTPVTTDQYGNYTLNLGYYFGPVYITSQGGTYTDTVTGKLIDLTNSPLILSAFVPFASGNVTVQINPLTSMAAKVALTVTGQGTPVATAANDSNTSVQDYFGLTSSILTTPLVNLTTAGCKTGASQASADVSAILAGISQLAYNYGVSSLSLVQALIQDVTSDGMFNGLASGATISVPLASGTGTVPLSTIEGTGLTGLANAITAFMTSPLNVCQASVDQAVISALSNTDIFTVPAAPTGVTATAEYGAAIISWNPVPLATSYNLYMATSSGVTPTSTGLPNFKSVPMWTSPYAVSVGVSGTYYFVVTAVSATTPLVGFESAASAQVSAAVTANAFPSQWAQTSMAGSSASLLSSATVTSDSSVYAAGYITGTGTYNFGNSVTAAGTYSNGINIVLVKYSSSGAAQWARTVTAGSNDSLLNSVSVASDGSVYAAGYVYGPGTFNFGNSVSVGTQVGYNPVLVKYDSSGTAQWAQTVTAGGGGSFFNSVSVAADGSVYAAGYIEGTGSYNFGGISSPVAGTFAGDNIVLVKYNSSGVAQWARTVTAGSDYSTFFSVSVASDGSVYAAGGIYGTGTFNFGGISSPVAGRYASGYNTVLVKYDSSGTAQWAQSVTAGSSASLFSGVCVGSDGSVYAAGYIEGTGSYSFGNITTAGMNSTENIVLVMYDSSGAAKGALTMLVGSDGSVFNGVSVASDGSVYAAGEIAGTGIYNLGNGVTAAGASGGENIVLVKYYNSSGGISLSW